jgi:predicted histidine transporter YuiF (NhaC family)
MPALMTQRRFWILAVVAALSSGCSGSSHSVLGPNWNGLNVNPKHLPPCGGQCPPDRPRP